MQFVIYNGDGAFDTEPMYVEQRVQPWAVEEIEGFGPAIILFVTKGQLRGQYIAVTSHTRSSFMQAIETNGLTGVVVHQILDSGRSFDGSRKKVRPLGKAIIKDRAKYESEVGSRH